MLESQSTAASVATLSPLVNVLFFNHKEERCGVYQMGKRIGITLADADVVSYIEIASHEDAIAAMQSMRPRVAIYNWHPSTIPWAPIVVKNFPGTKHIGLIHEISPESQASGAEIFPLRIACDPSFICDDQTMFSTVRHVPRYEGTRVHNDAFTVGSFGFAVGGKMFPAIAAAVAQEFPGARIRIRIPSARYGDDTGAWAQQLADATRSAGSGVSIDIDHSFLPETELIQWLASNDLNVFFYDLNPGRGISSALDYAIAARKPIAINSSQMFRHVSGTLGVYPERSLKDSLSSEDDVIKLYDTWSTDRLVQDYRGILARLSVES